ncbi:hypothetical protein ACIBVL_04485 [Streptomyces sp. NPDC049687]|uniref:hypothetical protein n=1 Tax=Streptomyces sp. NPDC049687 TaxID=3365596 RepID=UPI0037B4442E
MPPSRARLSVMAAVLGVVAVLGIVWLVRSATVDSGTSADHDATGSVGTRTGSGTHDDGTTASGTASGNGTSGGGTSTGGETAGDGERNDGGRNDGETGGDGETTDGGRRSLHVNGLHLDGDRGGEGCLTVINKTGMTGTVDSVSFAVKSGPQGAAVRSDDGAHCSGDYHPEDDPNDRPPPPCRAVRLPPSGRCLAGVVPAAGAKPGAYDVEAWVHVRYLCDDPENSPCSEIHWGARPPTRQDPVLVISDTKCNVPQPSLDVGPSRDAPPEPEPDDSPAPDSPPEPDSSPSPPSPPSPENDDGRGPAADPTCLTGGG